ncbi:MAG: toll/interleukin-1 receptor domain-containing protein [Gammaproteobacteria bacterium]|nr:toll/interleukin-1 receptor domain-containing protein [Gammaproteobacteria bacterium]
MTETGQDLFISYERQDAQDSSLLLYQHLASRFGEHAVFRDQQNIPSGAKWKDVLKEQVLACKGFILVIGPDWNQGRVQEKLHDPDNWVRQEILTAMAAEKPIFPVLMRDAKVPPKNKLPEGIRPALEDCNHFRFHDGPNWVKDLDRLCNDIAMRTALKMAGQSKSRSSSLEERLISQLDRNKEAGCVNKNFSSGKRLFLAIGASKAGFRYFAIRCALEAMRSSTMRSAGYQEVALRWSRFAETEPSVRQSLLLAEITENLLKQTPAGSDGALLESIKRKLRNTYQPTVLHSTVRNFGRGTQNVIDEWFGFWDGLFSQQTAPTRVAVLLFVEQRSWSPFPVKPTCNNHCQCIVDPELGKVEHRHLKEWMETQLQKLNDDSLYRQVKKKGESLFRFPRRTRHFEDVSESIL